ncbi:hypothetical protein [Paenibacillus polymyxa]|uniref:hypothetical protein n=1 Tax=Paenibacillus polymyxa TaxID=1406 RepID=UPI00287FEC63|nr:hypothetical protein [Paenibacillus polymyxa]
MIPTRSPSGASTGMVSAAYPYADMHEVTNLRTVDYENIEASVLEADSQGIKC